MSIVHEKIQDKEISRIPRPPRTLKERLVWLGAGFLWMVSAASSGELLFTPRVGALYGYTLIWALVIAIVLKWFINREIGRFTTCTGRTILHGFSTLPGPRHWALWVVLLPQLLVAVATVAGLASSAATALILALPGNVQFWTTGAILASTALVVFGRYRGVEIAATTLAVVLAAAAVIAAITVEPRLGNITPDLITSLPEDIDFGEILP